MNQYVALLAVLLFTACSREKPLPPAATADAAPAVQPAASAKQGKEGGTPPAQMQHNAAAPQTAACRNLRRAEGIDDLVRQIYENLDTPCLFERPVQELAAVWGVYAPEPLPDLPKDSSGLPVVNEETAPLLERYFLKNRQFMETQNGLALSYGESYSSGGGYERRRTRRFSIEASIPYRQEHGGFGGSFHAGGLPGFLRGSGSELPHLHTYRWFNRQRSPDLPYLEILSDPQTGGITSITVYENVKIPESGIHKM